MRNGHCLNNFYPTCAAVLQLEQQQKLVVTLVVLIHVNCHIPLLAPIRKHIRKSCLSEANMFLVVRMQLKKIVCMWLGTQLQSISGQR